MLLLFHAKITFIRTEQISLIVDLDSFHITIEHIHYYFGASRICRVYLHIDIHY